MGQVVSFYAGNPWMTMPIDERVKMQKFIRQCGDPFPHRLIVTLHYLECVVDAIDRDTASWFSRTTPPTAS